MFGKGWYLITLALHRQYLTYAYDDRRQTDFRDFGVFVDCEL